VSFKSSHFSGISLQQIQHSRAVSAAPLLYSASIELAGLASIAANSEVILAGQPGRRRQQGAAVTVVKHSASIALLQLFADTHLAQHSLDHPALGVGARSTATSTHLSASRLAGHGKRCAILAHMINLLYGGAGTRTGSAWRAHTSGDHSMCRHTLNAWLVMATSKQRAQHLQIRLIVWNGSSSKVRGY
jgi:hypothetical protein